MRIALEPEESLALNRLRGLPENAHMMLMSSGANSLAGPPEAFEELLEFIGEELSEGMLSKRDARTLYRLGVRIDPSCADWLAM